jgi:hypothetical protein
MITFSHIGTFLTVGNDIINFFWLYEIFVHIIATNPTFTPLLPIQRFRASRYQHHVVVTLPLRRAGHSVVVGFILAGGGAVNSVRLLLRNDLLELMQCPIIIIYLPNYFYVVDRCRTPGRVITDHGRTWPTWIYIYVFHLYKT